MKFFAGFITSVVIIALSLTGVYAYKELKIVDKEQPQQTEKIEDTSKSQQGNQSTQEQPQQTAPATIPSHEQEQPQQGSQDPTQDIKQGKSDIQYIQGQYEGLIHHMKERASQGADADEMHELQSQLDDYATQHANELNFDQGWEQ
ncbi:hypothetical protein [Staphylococcus equorum]|uniref:hypothetical protein n=1 Tax=Staphylococcus equorum TaxID=246432 RepID=UPI00085341CF|nr:hypothetical protein [Staphylococcus equorum]OEL08556.1 hypothetical protein AST04_06320 [Staphylococcus equorum]